MEMSGLHENDLKLIGLDRIASIWIGMDWGEMQWKGMNWKGLNG